MNKSTIILILTASILASCGNDDELTPQPIRTPEPVKMSFRVSAASTRTVLQSDNSVWFHDGDAINIFGECDDKHRFSTTLQEDAADAVFTGYAHKDAATDFYAMYPFQSGADLVKGNTPPMIIATLPNQQVAVQNSFDPSANLSVSRIKMSDTSQDIPEFTLYNACALAKFTVSEGLQLSSVELSGVAPMSGDMGILMPDNLEGITVTNQGIGDLSVTHTNVVLSAQDGTSISAGTYYIPVWPGEHSSLTIKLTRTDGKTKTGNLTNVTFKRAKILDLGTF